MRSVPAYAVKAMIEFVSAHAAKGDEEASRLLSRLPKKGKGRPGLAPGKSQAQRREERNERAAEIRAAVMARADGKCEWCGREGFALEWHHLIGGGLRRTHESVDTTVAICWDCHRGWERNDPVTLTWALAIARDCGSVRAVEAIEKRIAGTEAREAGGGGR